MADNPKVIIEPDESCKGQRFREWFGTVIEGRYPRTQEQIEAANQWYDKIMKSEAIDAIVVPGVYEKREGCYVIVTTEYSKKVYEQNILSFQHMGMITNPDWLHRGIYWYDDLAPGNVQGMMDWWHRGRWLGPVIQVIDKIFWLRGQPHWRMKFCDIPANYTGPYLQQGPMSYQDYFRSLIYHAFMPSFIIEYRIDLSREWFRGLSIGMRISTNIEGIRKKNTNEAMFIVGCEDPPWQREDKCADDWWKYNHWQSLGQLKVLSEWGLKRQTAP